MTASPVLSIRDLTTEFDTDVGLLRAVDSVSIDLFAGEVLGLVGESGSGKSATVLSALRLIPEPPARVRSGSVMFEGYDLLRMSRRKLKSIRGSRIGMVFQDPMTSLNPVLSVGQQLVEVLEAHDPTWKRAAARARAADLLATVGLPDPSQRLKQYPHELSGGMRQRVMIAIAMANNPRVLIADEPTTALDVTIQAQVLRVLEKSRTETGAAAILITHDLGIIAEMADRVAVMYAGRIVESGTVDEIFNAPRHPYTVGLLGSLPTIDGPIQRLSSIEGSPPDLVDLPPGCAFLPRCRLAGGRELCRSTKPPLVEVSDTQLSACHFANEVDLIATGELSS